MVLYVGGWGVTVQPVVLEIGPGGEKDKVTLQ